MEDKFMGGAIIRQIRLEKKMSIKDLAALANVNYVWLSKVERGIEIPSEDLIKRLASALDYQGHIDKLIASFGKVPKEIEKLILEDPGSVIELPNFFKSRRLKNGVEND